MTDRVELWIVDRLEGARAVLERALHEKLDLPRTLLPSAARQGDVLRVRVARKEGESTIVLERDPVETARRAAEADAARDRLRARDPGGDVRL